jgi:hypothetical protein
MASYKNVPLFDSFEGDGFEVWRKYGHVTGRPCEYRNAGFERVGDRMMPIIDALQSNWLCTALQACRKKEQ